MSLIVGASRVQDDVVRQGLQGPDGKVTRTGAYRHAVVGLGFTGSIPGTTSSYWGFSLRIRPGFRGGSRVVGSGIRERKILRCNPLII